MKKTILITGATDGIGRATALALAKMGHAVILHGRNAKKLDDLKAEIGANASLVQADMADLSQVAKMAQDLSLIHI